MHEATPLLSIGGVEQAIAGGHDPINPPVSISRNGSLAKWRAVFQAVDVRVDDPGLRRFKEAFTEAFAKIATLGLEALCTLPESLATTHELPPPVPRSASTVGPSSVGSAKSGKPGKPGQKPGGKPGAGRDGRRDAPLPPPRATHLVTFRTVRLAVPRAVHDPELYQTLEVADCAPIIDLAAAHGCRRLIVPVSSPGLFLDPAAADEFRSKVRDLTELATRRQMQVAVRSGGLTRDFFRRLHRETGCRLALDAGFTHLEGENVADLYREFHDLTEVVFLHQVIPGIDKWAARLEAMARSARECLQLASEVRQAVQEGESKHAETLDNRLGGALRAYAEASRSPSAHLGLFQSGDLNIVPLLRAIRQDIDAGRPRVLILDTVPHTRNVEQLHRYLLPEGLPGVL
jgi:hypothetical protein